MISKYISSEAINNAGAYLFESIYYEINGKKVDSVQSPGIVGTLRGYTCYEEGGVRHLSTAGCTYPGRAIRNAPDGSRSPCGSRLSMRWAYSMIKTLIDWLAGVHAHFNLCLETLHLCVAITDRYLQENKDVDRHVLQLVGISSLMIAAKYEEICTPCLEDFVDICSHTYSKRQILAMERVILKQLDFSLGRPLSVHFLRIYNKIAKVRSEQHCLGKFMLELALLKYEVSHIPPSLIAAAACCLSMGILGDVKHIEDLPGLWTPTLVHYTTYEYSDFEDILVVLSNILVEHESSKFQRIRRKYSAPNQNRISLNSKLNGPLMRQLTSDEGGNLLDRRL